MSSSGVTIETKIPLPDKTADSLTSVMTITDNVNIDLIFPKTIG